MLDTNICIYIINKRPAHVVDRLGRERLADASISTSVYFELLFGVELSSRPERNREALHHFLTPFEIVDIGSGLAEECARVRRDLSVRGRQIGALDVLIGVHALVRGSVLVTNNVKEIRRIAGLPIEN